MDDQRVSSTRDQEELKLLREIVEALSKKPLYVAAGLVEAYYWWKVEIDAENPVSLSIKDLKRRVIELERVLSEAKAFLSVAILEPWGFEAETAYQNLARVVTEVESP